ncbi:hypothetical protein MRY87_07810 [bacterium]|nr:hypothetical protein [bacterium]
MKFGARREEAGREAGSSPPLPEAGALDRQFFALRECFSGGALTTDRGVQTFHELARERWRERREAVFLGERDLLRFLPLWAAEQLPVSLEVQTAFSILFARGERAIALAHGNEAGAESWLGEQKRLEGQLEDSISLDQIERAILEAYRTVSLRELLLKSASAVLDFGEVTEDLVGLSIEERLVLNGAPIEVSLAIVDEIWSSLYLFPSRGPRDLLVSPSQIGLVERAEWEEVFRNIQRLSGATPEDREETLKRFSDGYPVSSGGDLWTATESGWKLESTVFGFQVPYGAYGHEWRRLEVTQVMLDRGYLDEATVTVRGRMCERFVERLSQFVFDRRDPFPDVEIRYEMPLPSGASYPITVKAAENRRVRPAISEDELPEEDRAFVRAVGHYFSRIDFRTSLEVLTTFRVEDFPEDRRTLLESPITLPDLDNYDELRGFWARSQVKQVLEVSKGERETPWLAEAYSDRAFFRERSMDVLKTLPEHVSHPDPEMLDLSAEEREEVLEESLDELFALCNRERERIQTEDPARHEERITQGYRGPREGYQLPFAVLWKDMAVSYRKKRSFVEKQAQKKERSPEEIEIPEGVGLSYNFGKDIYRADELPGLLEQLRGTKPFRRVQQLRLVDPLAPEGFHPLNFTEVQKVPYLILSQNAKRLRPVLTELFQQWEGETSSLTGESPFGFQRKVFISLVRDLWDRIDPLSTLEKNFRRDERIAFRELHENNERDNVPPDQRRVLERGLQRILQGRQETTSAELFDLYMRLDYLTSYFLPLQYREHAFGKFSIVDREVIKLIYVITADGEPLFSPEPTALSVFSRRTHSEISGGRGVYAAGSLHLALFDHHFRDLDDWREHRDRIEAEPEALQFSVTRLDNETGHFLMPSEGLPYATNVILSRLKAMGIPTDHCQVVDCITPGMKVKGTGVFHQ